MEDVKDITINDMGNTLYFRIRLFDAEKGLDFIDKIADSIKDKQFSVKNYLNDLIPLASLLDVNGVTVVKASLTLKDCYGIIRNPLAIVELGTEIFKFQEVFMKDSVICQQLMQKVGNIWNTSNSESITEQVIF